MRSLRFILILSSISLFIGSCNTASKEEAGTSGFNVTRNVIYLDSAGKGRFLQSSGRVKVIMTKLYEAGITNKIPVYADEALSKAMDMETAKKRGSNTVTLDVADPKNPAIPKTYDTTVYFDASQMRALQVVEQFRYNSGAESGEVKLLALAPAYRPNIPGVNLEVFGQLFYIKTADLSKVLTKEDIAFLKEFAFKSLSVPESQAGSDF